MAKIGVIGAGAWGTAIANLLASNGHDLTIWALEKETVANINNGSENKIFLPNIKLSENIRATSDFNDFKAVEAIFLVVPTQFLAVTITPLKDIIGDNVPLIICSKGIENKSKKLLSDIIAEIFPNNAIAAMSGPNYADEIAKLYPAITTVASSDEAAAERIAGYLRNDSFRVYTHNDIVSVELAGALKNVIAIASGIATGLELSTSTKCAIITKGLHEIARLSERLGGHRETLLEACGVGDLTLTCMSPKSRNMSLGIELGKGRKLQDILAERKTVAEGAATAKAVYEIIQELDINCHIFSIVYQVLYEGLDVENVSFV